MEYGYLGKDFEDPRAEKSSCHPSSCPSCEGVFGAAAG